jgi:hypothetical protein
VVAIADAPPARVQARRNLPDRADDERQTALSTEAFGMRLAGPANPFRAIVLGVGLLLPAAACAEQVDTEHLFGFMIGADVGSLGEREFQSETTVGRGKAGAYRTLGQEFELEFVPARNIRIELGAAVASHDIGGLAESEDRRRRLSFQGVSVDLRYRFLDRDAAPFGLTVAVQNHADRIDETTAARVRSYGAEFTLALDRELLRDAVVAAINLIYQPEWTRFIDPRGFERESSVGVAIGAMTRVGPDLLLGGEARYLRRYEGVALNEFAGEALFVGPTAYLQLSKLSRLTAAWSTQAWGRSAGSRAGLDLVGFERHQARLVFGFNF